MWEKKHNLLAWAKKASKMAIFGLIISVFLTFNLGVVAFAEQAFSWQGEAINFNGKTFSKQAVENQPGKVFFVAKEGDQAHVLSFEGDPKQASSAQYEIYQIDNQRWTNRQDQGSVKLAGGANNTGQTETATATSSVSAEGVTTSCNVDGIGWILCPMLKKIAEEMDKIQAIVAGFMEVRPISTDQESTLVKAWQLMRNISNIVFIIVFLLIIISYILNRGIDNYGIKKILPKLIVGAILVNLSFYICAIAVDLANIIGGSVAGLFRELQLQASNGQSAQISWYEFTKAALSGGSLVVAGAYATSFAFAGVGGLLLTLASAVVGAAITLFVTFIILAGRQALIITLIVISPLAFVAMLMPNTEGYYKKWFEMMKKLLLLLPMFSVVYGGAQLAGGIIIATAQDVFTLLLGMIVQVIPFLMLPKMVKDSDSILGSLGDGLEKTIFSPIRDRAKGFFNARINERQTAYKATEAKSWELSKKLTQAFDRNRRMVEERTKFYSDMQDSRYIKSKADAKADGLPFSARNRLNKLKLQEAQIELDLANAKADLAIDTKETIAKLFKEISKNDSKNIDIALAEYSNLEQKLAKASLHSRIKKNEDEMATGLQAETYNAMLQKNFQLDYRGVEQSLVKSSTGVFDGGDGSSVAIVSKMLAANRKEYGEAISSYKTALENYKLTNEQLIDIVVNKKKAVGLDDKGNTFEFDGEDAVLWEAAASKLLPFRIDLLTEMLKETSVSKDGKKGKFADRATQLSSIIKEHGLGKLATYLGNVSPEIIEHNLISEETLPLLVMHQINKGRFSSNDFIAQDKDATEEITKVINSFKNVKFGADGKPAHELGRKLGYGIDDMTMEKCVVGMKQYQTTIQQALDPKGETYRQLKQAQVKNLQDLDRALSAYTKTPPLNTNS